MTDLTTEIEGTIELRALAGAVVYLQVAGAVPRSELVRVLASHLEISHDSVNAALGRLIVGGTLQSTGSTVALPTGTAARDTEENRA